MARPLWSDAGNDPKAVAAHLDALAATAAPLRFEPRQVEVDVDVLHQAAILRARAAVASSHGEGDRILAQEVRAIDDLVRSANLLMERLREWYALHAPEAVRAVEGKELADLVAEHTDRAAVLQAIGQADSISMGTDLEEADMDVLRGFASALKGIHASWDALERRVNALMTDVAPNLESVVGPVLGARLIAQAGSLQRLAGFPAGTIQTLGAETALFRHLKEGTKPPKHGILFQHPKVHQAQAWQRGPIAKALSLQAALAAKADAYTGRDMKDELAQRLEADMERILRERNKPPKRPVREARKPFGKPGKPYGKPGGRPGGKPYGKPGGKPYGKPGGKPGGKPYGKPGGAKPRKKGPGAFRNQGDGPVRPPGGGR